jgi:hypothetical protein
MARKLNVAPHIRRIHAHHKRHKKKLLGLYHKIRTHPGCYKPGKKVYRGKAPKSHPRKPAGLNKRGSGLWDHVKKAWNWVTNHKVVKDLKKEAIKHGKAAVKDLADEASRRGKAYIGAQASRGKQWLKDQANAASARVRNKVEKHLSDASNKIEGVVSKVNKSVSKYTGASDGMPGRTVGSKKGSGCGGGCGSKKGEGWMRRRMRQARFARLRRSR